MKISLILLTVVVALPLYSQWSRTSGPEGVAIRSLTTVENIIYAGTEVNGVYISTDDGLTWLARNAGIETYGISSIINYQGYIFAGTRGGGVYRSSDGGVTWTAPSNGNTLFISALVANDSYIFAGAGSLGIYRSSDNGVTWAEIISLSGVDAMGKSGNKIFVSASFYNYATTDNGVTWFDIPSLAGSLIWSFYSEGNTVFAGGVNKIYRSTNNGSNFTTIDLNFNFSIVNIYSITAVGSALFAGTSYDGVYKSTDNGSNWFAASTGMGPKNVRALTSNSSTLIAGSHYVGMYRSTNLGDSWIKSVSGFPAGTSILSMLNIGSSLFAGTRDGAYRTDNNGDSWIKLTGENDTINYCDVWAMCEFHGTIYASMQLYFDATVYKSTNKGASWTRCGSTGLPTGLSFIKGLVASGDNLVAGTDEGIYYSVDGGNSWNATNLLGLNIPSLAGSGDYVYAAVPSGSGVYKSSNNGVTWTISLPSTVDYVEVAAVDNYAFAGAFFGSMRHSSNYGGTWFASNGFPTGTSVFALGPSDDGMILAGTDLDPTWIYASFNYENFYQPYSEGLAVNASVEAFAISDTFMFAGTDYNGVWRRLRPGIVSVEVQTQNPQSHNLAQNYPNPFNPVTTIRYTIPSDGLVSLTVFNTIGEKVETLVSEFKNAGEYYVKFDASQLTSGIYLYKLQSGSFVETKKMILLK